MMVLPREITEKLNLLLSEFEISSLSKSREVLTKKYKNFSGSGKISMDSELESLTYALCRMPATFSVLSTLLSDLKKQGLIFDVSTVLDAGAGTGATFFALKNFDSKLFITSVDRDEQMLKLFKTLTNHEALQLDLTSSKIPEADLIVSSYVLSELNEQGRNFAFKSMLHSAKKFVLIVDSGTPMVFEEFLKLKETAKDFGFKVIAPCLSQNCALCDDFCQFYTRVERSSILRQSKSATLPYEDEKYFYLLFCRDEIQAKTPNLKGFSRVIRRPVFRQNLVELMLCSHSGVKTKIFTKKNAETYKIARKIKINELIEDKNEN